MRALPRDHWAEAGVADRASAAAASARTVMQRLLFILFAIIVSTDQPPRGCAKR